MSELSNKIAQLRKEYSSETLSEQSVNTDPFLQFEHWFNEAMDAEILEPNAMSLATADKNGIPSVRTVLLKYFDQAGFTFFTNYESRKAVEINENPNAALLFAWLPLQRQVKISGNVKKIDKADSLKYFLSRPKGSQLGAWVSKQSTVISNRSLLMEKLEEVKRKFKDGEVPLPSFWGGYCIEPTKIEFWQGQQNRLHDRIQYSKQADGSWKIERLAP